MVIEPLSLIFFRVPSCAAEGTATARASVARIRVIGRFMVILLVRRSSRRWMAGGLHDSTGVPRFLSKRRRSAAERQNASSGLEFGLLPERGTRHEPGADPYRARSPGRPGGPRR